MGLHPRATTPTSLTCEQANISNVLKRANAPILACGGIIWDKLDQVEPRTDVRILAHAFPAQVRA